MLLLLFFMIIINPAQCTENSMQDISYFFDQNANHSECLKDDFLQYDPIPVSITELINKRKTIQDYMDILKTVAEDNPILPEKEELKSYYYEFIKSCSILPKTKAPQSNSLLRVILIKNNNQQLKGEIYPKINKARLYYAIKYKETEDICTELKKYHSNLRDEDLLKISKDIILSEKPTPFYTENYQKNFQKIMDYHNKSEQIVMQKLQN